MAEKNNKDDISIDKCPHCGNELSPWQKVLLRVDRAIVCQHCWYRIILDPFDEKVKAKKPPEDREGDTE